MPNLWQLRIDGTTEPPVPDRVECCDCGEETRYPVSHDNDNYCEECFDDSFCTCEGCADTLAHEDSEDCFGNTYCEDCADDFFPRCESCCERIAEGDCENNHMGEAFCSSCYHETYTSCEECGCELHTDDARYDDFGAYCEDCYVREGQCRGYSEGNFFPGSSYSEVGSRRRFGVELETSSCDGSAEGTSIFGCKGDGSIDGMEFVSPPMEGDNGLREVRKLCEIANDNGWEVDKSCGYHLHVNVGDLTHEERASVAYAYLLTAELWNSFFPDSRRDSTYACGLCWTRTHCERYRDTGDAAYITDWTRYQWLNVSAYHRHGTFEVRLHTGTLNGRKVCNWIKAHTRFVDYVACLDFAELDDLLDGDVQDQFDGLCQILDDMELCEFYAERHSRYNETELQVLQPA